MTKTSDDIDGIDDEDAGEHARWVKEIILYDREVEAWEKKGKDICKRYKDTRNNINDTKARYNILWSNTQTLLPAVYARDPKVDINRRNTTKKDDLGRVTADILERSTQYFVAESSFGSAMHDSVLDRLLPGRGVSWVRYVPHFRDVALDNENEEIAGEGDQITDDVYTEEDDPAEQMQEIEFEEICFDYVNWLDYGHTVARTNEEVRAKWRKVYMTKEEGRERFGEIFDQVPLDYTPKGLNEEKKSEDLKKATIYEIWDKPSEKAIWIHKDYPKLLDKKDDPLGLKGFFPCPDVLLATTANDSLVPTPDYCEYQDQAMELDRITGRITQITKGIKVCGVRDASAEGLERLLAEGVENTLVPVENWSMLAEKGGLKGTMELLPMQEMAQTLLILYEAREKVLQDIYQITGIADIIRGQSDPNETLGAQQLKGQFATLRLSAMQRDVQRFARDLVQIGAQIIAKHFSIDTIKKICGVDLLTNQEKMQISQYQQQQQQMQMMQQQGQGQPGQPPMMPMQLPPNLQKLLGDPEELAEMMQNPTWEEVEGLLRDDAMLGFRIDIETDSTIQQDQEQEKQSRIELLTAVTQFIEAGAQIQDPDAQVFMAQLLGFGVRGFKAGKEVEGAVELFIKKVQDKAKNPPPAQPNPEMAKVEGQMKIEQEKLQAQQQQAQQQAQLEMQKEQMKQQTIQQQNQLEAERSAQEHAGEMQLKREQMQHDLMATQYKTDAEIALKRELGLIQHAVTAATSSDQAQRDSEGEQKNAESNAQTKEMMGALQAHLKELHQHITAPKSVKVVRQADGSLTGVTSNG